MTEVPEQGTQPEKKFGLEDFKKMIDTTARHELYYRITGQDKIWDPNDPTVAQNVDATVNKALREGSYRDTEGKQHIVGFWSDQEKGELALTRLKRLISPSKGGASE